MNGEADVERLKRRIDRQHFEAAQAGRLIVHYSHRKTQIDESAGHGEIATAEIYFNSLGGWHKLAQQAIGQQVELAPESTDVPVIEASQRLMEAKTRSPAARSTAA